MLSFAVYGNGQPAKKVNLSGAYLVGADDVPLRADISFKDGIITCAKRATGPAGLALLWDTPGVGTTLLETIRVPEREKPYVLQVELVRARLMRIHQKLEDWGLLDYAGVEDIGKRVGDGRDLLIKALQADSPSAAADLADQALAAVVAASEDLTRYHAEFLLGRRKQSGGFGRHVLGCSVQLDKPTEPLRKRISSAFDFATLPLVWREIEPTEQTFNWKPLDAWVEMLSRHKVPIKGSPLLSFRDKQVPDWLYIWEHDFDTIRDLAFEHVRRVINRYGQQVQSWDVISGIHADNCFTFNFEQLMELTRMSAALTKQIAPQAIAIIDLVAPWGEYYARNQRTIPPLLYADMAVQSGINFDAFGLQFHFGPGVDGMFVRDMFQISAMLDLFSKLGRPLHITAVEVPSDTKIPPGKAGEDEHPAIDGGVWREPWTEQIQSEWARRFLDMALSKSFVESVSWHGLADCGGRPVPNGGLLHADLSPKPAYRQVVQLHSEIRGAAGPGGRGADG